MHLPHLGTCWGMETGKTSRGANHRRTLRRLMVDTTGNTMMIMAVAIFPIIGIVGSAFDIGRAYMTKTRLQQACDAGALAGRRSMTKPTFEEDTEAQTQADNFFYFNFPEGKFGTSNLTFTPKGTPDKQVEATASVTVPMTLMKLFKSPSVALEVECEAIYEIANTDIMFVLDVTGSMNCAVGGGSSCSSEATNAKIKALRTAVVSFYDTLNTAISSEARLRIGFMPYSGTVNVGASIPSQYLKSIWSYQSRERVLKSTSTSNTNGNWPSIGSTPPAWSAWSGYSQVSNNGVAGSWACSTPATTNAPSGESTSSSSSTNSTSGVVTTTTITTRTMTQTEYKSTYLSGPPKTCKIESRTRSRTETKTDTETKTPDYDWHYKRWTPPQDLYDSYKAGSPTTTPTGNATGDGPATGRTATWNGCIEEAKTVANATFTTLPVSGAYDLNIDLVPSSEDERWAPAWSAIIYYRTESGSSYPKLGPVNGNNNNNDQPALDENEGACPKAAQKLKEMTKTEVEDYLKLSNGFKALGYTYHDTGIIWGGRFISPDGIFASENKEVPSGQKGAGRPINRHIIYMTDGSLMTSTSVYGLYGLESLDGRVAAGAGGLTERHRSRFNAVCNAIKGKNITIWVVVYAVDTDEVDDCASPGKAFKAEDDAKLKQQFETIASKIAELRLKR